MPDEKKRLSAESESAIQQLLRRTAGVYADGYSDGATRTANTYDKRDVLPRAIDRAAGSLEVRLSLVEDAARSYVDMVGNKAKSLIESGLEGPQLEVELMAYARQLADNRGEIVAEMEYAQAKLDGAGHILDEAGMAYEWRFAHFDLGPDHEECVICEAIREKSPYTQDAAEAEGFPAYPHPGCDHGWVVVPEGELTQTEQFPGKMMKHHADGTPTPAEGGPSYSRGGGSAKEKARELPQAPGFSDPNFRSVPLRSVKDLPYWQAAERLPEGTITQENFEREGKPRSVPARDLIATQPYIDLKRIDSVVDSGGGTGKPSVVQYKGKLYIHDGHHRVVADMMAGKEKIDVNVLRLG